MATQKEIDALTAKLRNAHIKTLRDNYNAQISAAQSDLERAGEDYEKGAKEAYITRRIREKELPEKLASMGLYGGVNETLAAALMSEYQKQLDELSEKYARKREDALAEKQRRTAGRDNAINEYRLRNQLSDMELDKPANGDYVVGGDSFPDPAPFPDHEIVPAPNQLPDKVKTFEEILRALGKWEEDSFGGQVPDVTAVRYIESR